MAPSFQYWDITKIDLSHVMFTSVSQIAYVKPVKAETKKEREKRIASEKMLASWKIYNQKTPTIIEVKQICKPQHFIKYDTRRIRR